MGSFLFRADEGVCGANGSFFLIELSGGVLAAAVRAARR
jgi:hypothetical protein